MTMNSLLRHTAKNLAMLTYVIDCRRKLLYKARHPRSNESNQVSKHTIMTRIFCIFVSIWFITLTGYRAQGAPELAGPSVIETLKSRFPDRARSFADTNLGKIHFEDAGPKDADPIVLVHGVSGPFAVWDQNMQTLLDAGYRIIRFDLFGRGMSARLADSPYGLPLYLNQLELLLAHLQVDRPITIIGSSLGAIISTEYTLQHPERVKAVILIGPAGFPIHIPPAAILGSVPLLGDVIFKFFGSDAIKTQNKKYFVDGNPPKELWDYFTAQLEVAGTAEAMRTTIENAPVQSYLESYKQLGASGIPVGIIWGRQDRTFDYANHETLLKLIPTAKFTTIEHAGHLPQYERADETNAALKQYLAAFKNAPASKTSTSPRLFFSPQTSKSLNTEAVDNAASFEADFFKQWPLIKKSIPLASGATKEYLFPTLYNRVVTSVAVFTCDDQAVAKLIEDPSLEPIKIMPGHALLTVTSYRYNDVRGVPPYNEVAISVLVKDRETPTQVISTLISLAHMRDISAYVLSMPVTTLENQIRGRTIWGLPKDVRPIGLRQVGSDFVTTVTNDDGKVLFELAVPMTGESKAKHQSFKLRSVLNGQALISSTEAKGEYAASSSVKGFLPHMVKKHLVIGDAPESQWLKTLNVNPTAIHTEFSYGTMNMLSLPEPHKGPETTPPSK